MVVWPLEWLGVRLAQLNGVPRRTEMPGLLLLLVEQSLMEDPNVPRGTVAADQNAAGNVSSLRIAARTSRSPLNCGNATYPF